MQNISCHHCNTKQPTDYETGDRCIECGDVVREDVNCAWCTHLVPNSKFCRDCGFEMVEAPLFGVARMLKDSGIDKLSLAQKVRELPADIAVHYKTIYNRHYGILLNQIEQVRLCEEFLLHKQYSFDLEQEYLKKIPFDDETLEILSQGPKGNFKNRPDRIPEIISTTPLQMTGWYATIAGIHAPIQWEKEYENQRYRQLEKLFVNAVMNNNPLLVDVIAGFAHWNMLSYLMDNNHYPTVKGTWNTLLFEFASNNWHVLSRKAKQSVSPLIVRLSSFNQLSQAYQEDIKKHVNEALESSDTDLQFAAACVTLNGSLLYKVVEQTNERKSLLAARIILDYNLPQQTALLLHHSNDRLQNLAFKEIVGQQRMAGLQPSLDRTIANALVQYLQKDSNQSYRNEAIEILGKFPEYASDVARITQQHTGASNNPDVLLQTLKATQDASLIASLTDQILQIELSQKTLNAIASKKTRKVSLSEFVISKIVDYTTSDHFEESCLFVIPSILSWQLKQKDSSSFYTLKGILNGVFIKNSERLLKMARNIFMNVYDLSFIFPGHHEVVKFAVNEIQLKWFFDDYALFIKSLAHKITVSDMGDLSWFYDKFWKPYQQEEWPQLLAKNDIARQEIINAWLQVIYNATLSGSYRAYGIKALRFLIPIMSKDEKLQVQQQIINAPMPEGDMHYLIEQWQTI